MSEKRRIVEVPTSALRDHDSDAKLDRGWRRLESELSSAPARSRSQWWWAPAAAAIVFGAGVVVGARWARPEAPMVPAVAVAEPASVSEPAPVRAAVAEPGDQTNEPEKKARGGRALGLGLEAPEKASAPDEATGNELAESAVAPVAPKGPPEWQRLASLLEFEAASRALQADGGFQAVMAKASAEQLMSLVDIARATKQRGRALEALRLVIQRYPSDPNAPIAAMQLGNMLEATGDRVGAAQAFAAYRRLSPKGDFAEDALARQVDVAIERGDLELAKKLADQYAIDFPNGRHLGAIRGALARLAGIDGGVDVGEPPSESPEEEPLDEPAAAPDSEPAR